MAFDFMPSLVIINYIETSTSERDGITVTDFIPILETTKEYTKDTKQQILRQRILGNEGQCSLRGRKPIK